MAGAKGSDKQQKADCDAQCNSSNPQMPIILSPCAVNRRVGSEGLPQRSRGAASPIAVVHCVLAVQSGHTKSPSLPAPSISHLMMMVFQSRAGGPPIAQLAHDAPAFSVANVFDKIHLL